MFKETPRQRVLFVRTVISGLLLLLGFGSWLSINFNHPKIASAVTSSYLNFQARLETSPGAIAPDGNYNVRFKIYSGASCNATTGTGCTQEWTEDWLNSASQGIRVANGYLTANLGKVTAFPSTLDWSQKLWISMNIGGTATGSPTWDGEMFPLLQITAVPYAFQSNSANQLKNIQTGGTGTLSFATLSGNLDVTLPVPTGAGTTATVCYQGDTACGFLTTGTSGNFVQLQATSPGTGQAGNFNISGASGTGIGIAKVLQAATFDTASATTLNIGDPTTPNATSISLNVDTSVAANKNITFAAGTGSFDQSGSSGTFKTGTGNVFINGDTSVAAGKSISFAAGAGNFDMHLSTGTFDTGSGAVSLNGAATAKAGLTVAGTGDVAFQKGSDYSTTGTSNDVNFGTGTVIRLTGASAQTITGIAGGVDGRILTIVNAAAQAATLTNEDLGSTTATDRILTGTGSSISIQPDSAITLVYDSTTSRWRVTSGSGVNTVGPISGTSNANGATITGSTLNLTPADGTNGGVVTNTTQTFAGDKTFSGSITGNAGITTTGGVVSLQGNAASNLTTTSGSLTLDAATALNLGNTNATSVVIGNANTTSLTLGQSTATSTISIGSSVGNLATQTINIGTSATAGSTTNVNIGSTIAGVTTLQSQGGVKVSNLGTVQSTSQVVCRDTATGLLTTCDSGSGGKPFIQGGNSFGAAGDLGTNDNFALNIRTNNTTKATFDTSGNLNFATAGATIGTNSGNNNFTVQANGTGVLALNTSGAGTVNVATSGTTALALGNTGASFTAESNSTANLFNGNTSHTVQIATGASGANSNGVAIGSSSAGSTTSIQGGTGSNAVSVQVASGGTLGVGNGAVAQIIQIGNTTGATGIAARVGTGNYSLDGVTNSTYDIGSSTTTGTIAIGGTAQTGASALTLGRSTATNTITVGSNVGASATQTINIGTSATASSTTTVNIGSTIAGVTTLQSQGGVKVSTLGTVVSTSQAICRDTATGLLTTCDSGSGGKPFIQGGNNFGATAVLGTLDANGLQIVTGSGGPNGRAFFDTSNHLYLGNAGSAGTAAAPTSFSVLGTSSSAAGAAGGSLTIAAGAGSTATTGSAGGSLTLSAGAAGGTGNFNGGNVTLQAGNSSTSSSTGNGGNLTLQAGSVTYSLGGNGGNVTLAAGDTADTTNGGNVTIRGGNSTGAGLGGLGGNVSILAGTSNDTDGSVNINNTTVYTIAGDPTMTTTGSFIYGGSSPIVYAVGNAASSASSFTVTGGAGNTASATTGVTAGTGEVVSVTSGAGGLASGASGANIGGNGGAITITSGAGGHVNSATGTAGSGGAISIQGGAAGTGGSTAGSVGAVSIQTSGGNTTIGSTTGASSVNVRVGTGNYSLDGVGGSTYNIGSSTVAGTIAIGGTAQTGNLTFGQSTATNTINIGSTAGAGNTQTVNIGTSATATSTTNVNIGSTIAGTTTLQSGGGVKISTLGTVVSTSQSVCRDTATGLLTTCDSGSGGRPFVQGGNSFGATAVLGTNDANGLQVITGSGGPNVRAYFDTSNNLYLGNAGTTGAAATPNAFTIRGTDSSTGGTTGGALSIKAGSGTTGNTNGGNLLLQGGAGFGTGTTGSVIVKANGTDSSTAFQVQNNGGNGLLTADTSGNAVILGSTGSITGNLQFKGSTAASGTVNITLASNNPNNITLQAYNSSAGTYTICTSDVNSCGSATGTYVSLQGATPGSQQTGNINISGTIIGATAIQSTLIDSVSGALNIGTTSATQINLNQNTILAAGKYIKITGDTTANRATDIPSPSSGMLFFDTTTNQLLQFNGTKWVSDRTNAIIVAANNSTQAEKDSADYVATGSDDGTTINSAINDADPAGSGRKVGTVVLLGGTYNLDTTAISVKNNVTLAGVGTATVLTYPNSRSNTTFKAITNFDTAAGTHVTIRDLLIDGNKAGQTVGTFYGIYFDHMGAASRDGGRISNVTIQNMFGIGIELTASFNNTLAGNATRSNSASGIFVTGSSTNTITGNLTQANNVGINMSTGNTNNTITGNTSQGNNLGGLFLNDNTAYNTVTGNNLSGNGSYGIFLQTSANNNVVSGNKIHDNGGSANNEGIKFFSSSSNSITSNDITDTSCTTNCYAIDITDSGSNKNYLSGNNFSGDGTHAATINDVGTGTVYATQSRAENGGQLTIRTANDANAFQVQNATGTSILNVNSSTAGVTIAGTLTSSGGTVSLNDNSNFNTSINTGSSTGTVSIGSSNNTGNFTLESGTSTTNLFNGATAHTIQFATGAAVQALTIGSTNTTSTLTLNAGTGTATGDINIGDTAASSKIIDIGSVDNSATTTVRIATASGTAQTVTAGSTNSGSVTTLQGGAYALAVKNTGVGINTTGNVGFDLGFGANSGSTRTLGVQATATNAAGTGLSISAGAAGAGASAFGGGTLSLTGGAAAGTGNANGGDVTVQGGAGVGTGVQGLVKLSTTAFTSAAGNQSFGAGGGTVTQASVDGNSTIEISETTTGPQTVTIPAPTNKVTGRLLYVTISGSNSITIAPNGGNSFTMNPSTGATLVWNTTINAGAGGWVNAGADGGSNSYIQNQNSADQTANFRISGVGRANGGLLAPSLDVVSGAITIGTGATSGSAVATGITIDSAASSTIAVGTSAVAHTINVGTSATAAQQIQVGSTNASSVTKIVGGSTNGIQVQSASTSAFRIQDGASFTLLNADTITNKRISIGTDSSTVTTSGNGDLFVKGNVESPGTIYFGVASNGVTIDSTNHRVRFTGTARNSTSAVLVPEYAGAVMTPTGSGANVGTMTSDFCSNSSPAINTGVCGVANDVHNYYSWTTSQASAQDYDIFVRWVVPSNYDTTDAMPAVTFYGWRTSTTNDAITVTIRNGTTTCGTATSAGGSNGAWTQTTYTTGSCGTITPGTTVLTFDIHMSTATGDFARVGEIGITYNAIF